MLNDAWSWLQLPDLDTAIDKELRRKHENEQQKREERKQEVQMTWQVSGAEAARKYSEVDEDKWCKGCKEILETNNKIKSIRGLAREIKEKTGYSFEAIEKINQS